MAASPPGDSDESSGRPGASTANDPNSADNLMLFVKENGIPKGESSLLRSSRSIVGPSEQSSQLVGGQHAKESDDSVAFGLPKKAYKRRNRSRSNRDGVRSNSTDVFLSSSVHTALPFRHVPRVVKGLAVDADNQEDHMISSNSYMNTASPNSGIVPEEEQSKLQLDMELDGGNAVELTIAQTGGGPSSAQIDGSAFKNMQDNQHNESLESDSQRTQNEMVHLKPEYQGGSEQVSVGGQECDASLAIANIEVQDNCSLINGFNEKIGDRKDPLIEVDNKNGVLGTKGLDLETSGLGAGVQINGNVNKEILTNFKSMGSNGYTKEDAVESGGPMNVKSTNSAEDNNEMEVHNFYDVANANSSSFLGQGNSSLFRDEEILSEKVSNLESKDKDPIVIEGTEQVKITSLENEGMPSILLDSNHPNGNEETRTGRLHCSVDTSVSEIPDPMFTPRDSTISLERQTCSQDLKLETKAHEDAILEEARVIEVSTLSLVHF